MNKFIQFMEEKFIPVANKISRIKALQAVSGGSMSLLGVIMVGAIFSVLTSITWAPYQNFLKATHLLTIINFVPNVTTELIGLFMAFSIAYNGAKVYGIEKNAFNTGVISLVAFILLAPITVQQQGMVSNNMFNAAYFGPKAVISAIVVSLIVIQIMKFFMNKNITIKMPEGVPPMVSNSFTSLIPAVVIVLVFGLVKYGFSVTHFKTFNDFIYTIIQTPLQSLVGSFPAFILLLVIAQLLWFFGIHGSQTVLPILIPVWLGYMSENTASLAAGHGIVHTINFGLWDLACIGGCGATIGLVIMMFFTAGYLACLCQTCLATIGLVIMMFFTAKSERYKAFGKITFPCGIFSVNEPLIFGLPLMLNVMTIIPFIVCPIVVSSVGYLLMKLHIIAPYVGILGTGSLPPFIHGMVNGSVSAGIYELVAVVLSCIIWYPFFKMLDKQALEEENRIKEEKAND